MVDFVLRDRRFISPSHQAYDGMRHWKSWYVRRGVPYWIITFNVGLHSDYVPLVNLIGVFFQIRDDYFNLQSKEVREIMFFPKTGFNLVQYETNKGFAEDLTEGKFSFPIVHGVRKDTTNRQLLSE